MNEKIQQIISKITPARPKNIRCEYIIKINTEVFLNLDTK